MATVPYPDQPAPRIKLLSVASMTSTGPSHNWQFLRQIGPLGLVILLHAAFFLALQSGLNKQVRHPEPREIFATLIAAQPAATPAAVPQAQPAPAQPKPPQIKPQITPKQVKPAPPAPLATPKSITAPVEAASAPETPTPASNESSNAVATNSTATATASAGQAAAGAPVQPRTVTSGVEYLQPPRPEYPSLSRRMGEEGTVMLRILISERGRAERAEIYKSSGVTRLDEAARVAALRAVFKPYTENGRPVPVYAILPISFQLDN